MWDDQIKKELEKLRRQISDLEGYKGLAGNLEKAATLEHNLFHVLMENITDNIYFKDRQSRFLHINRAMANYFGLNDPNEAVGKTDFNFFSQEHAQQAFEDELQVMESGEPVIGIEEKETWPDGRETWVSTSKIPLRDKTGKIIGTFGISRDITLRKQAEEELKKHRNQLKDLVSEKTHELAGANEHLKQEIAIRKETEKALRESEYKYRNIFESFHDVYYRTDKDGLITIISPSVTTQAGYDPKDVIGHPATDFYPDPENRAALLERLKETGSVNDYELKLLAKDGQIIDVSVSSSLVKDKEGNPIGVEGVLRNISQRKHAEKALWETKKQLETLIQSIPDIIFVKDAEGRYQVVNRAFEQMLGLKAKDIIGKTDDELLSPEMAKRSCESDQDVIKTGHPAQVEMEFQGPKGEKKHFDTIKSPLFDENRHFLGLVGVRRDITDRKRMEEEIREIAFHDTLTGLPNRILFYDRLDLALAQAKRRQGQMAILYLDLDYFKSVNDSLGHDAGDMLLRATAERLQAIRRESDTLSRMGGDEFILMLHDIHSAQVAHDVGQRILNCFQEPFPIKGQSVDMKASIGIAVYPQDGQEPEALIKSADQAMYSAKKQGRNQIQRFKEESIPKKSS